MLALEPWERAAAGLYLAMQYPTEVPGVRLDAVLAEALAARGRPADDLDAPAGGPRRSGSGSTPGSSTGPLNVDLSGGEKKRNETLQLAVLDPAIAMLDELDSGLDVDALRACARRVEALTHEIGLGVLAITHYNRLLGELKPDARAHPRPGPHRRDRRPGAGRRARAGRLHGVRRLTSPRRPATGAARAAIPSPTRRCAAEAMSPIVAVYMGSRSDWDDDAGRRRRARRAGCPDRGAESCRPIGRPPCWPRWPTRAEADGIEVIVAGAGGAAHLPGMIAAHTVVPVLGVPVPSKALNGLDSLLSIVQMPAGVPVGTLAIGAAGAKNAGLLAAAIVVDVAARAPRAAAGVAPAPDRRRARPPRSPPSVTTVGILGGGQLGRMLALAGVPLGVAVRRRRTGAGPAGGGASPR